VIYVCGFPRSGTTWLCRLLSDVLKSPLQLGSRRLRYGSDGGDYLIKRSHSPDPARFAGVPVALIVRDPRDTLVSLWHYKHNRPTELPAFIASQAARYDEHRAAWEGKATASTSYEALTAEPVAELRRVAEALTGNAPDDTALGLAVERQRGGDWLRKGVIGGWRDEPLERDAIAVSAEMAVLVRKYAISD
jgi:hypothetical protein